MTSNITDCVIRVVDYNTADSADGGGDDEDTRPEALDDAHIRLNLCAHAGHPVDEVTQAIREAREQGQLAERRDGYAVAVGRGEDTDKD